MKEKLKNLLAVVAEVIFVCYLTAGIVSGAVTAGYIIIAALRGVSLDTFPLAIEICMDIFCGELWAGFFVIMAGMLIGILCCA